MVWVAVVVLAVGGGFGLYWFQPWKLVTDQEVAESLASPVAGPPRAGSPTPRAEPAGSPGVGAESAGPTVISAGDFITHEHDTSGVARIIRDTDGTHRLELAGLDTSNGPDLRVWLTDQPVVQGVAGWRVFDDGEWVELGRLKGNRGDQVYRIPADVDPDRFDSVSIWCKRFAVSFGAAPLVPAG